jgi:hypothetical protein
VNITLSSLRRPQSRYFDSWSISDYRTTMISLFIEANSSPGAMKQFESGRTNPISAAQGNIICGKHAHERLGARLPPYENHSGDNF